MILLVGLALLWTGQDCAETRMLAQQAYEGRQYDHAERQFAAAVGACGPDAALLLALGQSQLLAKRPADTLNTLDRIGPAEAEYVSALKVRARALYLLGRDGEAVETLKRAATRAPDDPEVPYNLGRIFYQIGRHAQAADALRRATQLDPTAYRAWDNLGLALEALGDDAQAQQHYLRAIALVHTDHPAYDVVYANFAELLIRQGSYGRAFDLAAEAAERNPDDPRNLFLAGKALAELGRPDLAVRWFERAIVVNPDYPEPHYQLFQAYRRLGRASDAAQALEAFKAAAARAPKARR